MANPSPAECKQILRDDLIRRHKTLPIDLINTTQWKCANLLRGLLAEMSPGVIGWYMPLTHEINLSRLAQELQEEGGTLALPRVVAAHMPLVFNQWIPGQKFDADKLGLPCASGMEVLPTVLVIPMLGYNRKGYRLGYGGGFYDLTLASLSRPPVTIGVCYTEMEIEDFPAEAYDIPLTHIITGKEVITPHPL